MSDWIDPRRREPSEEQREKAKVVAGHLLRGYGEAIAPVKDLLAVKDPRVIAKMMPEIVYQSLRRSTKL